MEVPPAAVDEEGSETETEEESEDETLLTADERRRRRREREVDCIVFGNPHRAPNELLMEVLFLTRFLVGGIPMSGAHGELLYDLFSIHDCIVCI